MIKAVNIKTTVEEYKANVENQDKIAVFDIDNCTVIYEGEGKDWSKLQDIVEEKNIQDEKYYLIIVPHKVKQIREYYWR